MKRSLVACFAATVLAVVVGCWLPACGAGQPAATVTGGSTVTAASSTTILGVSSTVAQMDGGLDSTTVSYTQEELQTGIATVFANTIPQLAIEATPVIMEHPATEAVRAFEYDPGLNALILQVDTSYDPSEREMILEYAWSLTVGISGFYIALVEQDPDAAEPFIPYFPEFDLTVDGVDYFVEGLTMLSIGIDETGRAEWEDSLLSYRIE